MILFRNLKSLFVRAKFNNYFATAAASTMTNPIVTVQQGKLKGAESKLYDGSTFYSFKGIPYAQPPVGKLRFKAPLPPKSWTGVYEAIEHGEVCPQLEFNSMSIIDGDENCLFLNVYTKSLEPSSKLPVMVFVHGGAFMSGSGNDDMLGPKFLLQHDVILVTINYRLEALGFLCLDTPEVPGNAGMKDQVAALKWVQSNIEQFGGDPKNVCLFGESAGGASVTYHMLSPLSKGLFHKAISQSGSCFDDWAHGVDGRDRAFRAGKILGKETDNSEELLEFLQSLPATDLAALTNKVKTKDEGHRGLPIHFAPVVEKKFDNVEAFIDEEPVNLVLAKKIYKVPFISGYNSHEGLITVKDRIKKADFYNAQPEFLVPRSIARRVSEEKLKEFGARIKDFYFGSENISKKTSPQIVDMQSDLHFVYNNHRFVQFFATSEVPVYMYKFSCDTELNILKMVFGMGHIKGTCHADELFYIFSTMITEDAYKSKENLRNIIFKITKMWTDFAKTGKPTPDNSLGVQWSPYTLSERAFLNINEELTLGQHAEKERIEFWNSLYSEAGIPCITKSSL